jgi:undecaprenyl-diphosphatase
MVATLVRMADVADTPTNTSPEQDADLAVRPVREALKEALATVDSPEKAERVIQELTEATAGQKVEDVLQSVPPPDSPTQAAQSVQAAAQVSPDDQQAQAVLAETAREVIASPAESREALSQAAQDVFNPEQRGAPADAATEAQRDYLREALFRQLKPLDALDAKLFLKINGLPHTPALNNFFYDITTAFTGGAAWYALMGIVALRDPKLGGDVIRQVTLPLLIASGLVEFPIKSYFRRKRPFIDIVQAIVIGRKPGTWSFPSGHSAVAFAGAWLLGQHLPGQRVLLYSVAGMVAFSRIYLGKHYPGDVVAGSTLGVVFAMAARKVLGAISSNGSRS